MNQGQHIKPIDEILASIREALSDAGQALERGEDRTWRIEEAFVTMRILLETAGLPALLRAFEEMEAVARNNWEATETDESGEPLAESCTATSTLWKQRLAYRKIPL
jgi:hypothetical protein